MSIYDQPPAEWPIDLGAGVRALWVGSDLWIHFPGPGHEARVATAGPVAWAIVSAEPLTLHPSIKVSDGCGAVLVHGYVTGGRWRDCGDAPPGGRA